MGKPTIQKKLEKPADIATKELYLDKRNPRLFESGAPTTQKEIRLFLWRDFAVDEIALSIAANGFFRTEPLYASKEDGHLYVVEGNRRLAAVQLLLDGNLRSEVRATDLPSISSTIRIDLQTLPVVDCKREDIWQYLGFKHVNGPQQWQSYSKAQYIEWVRNTLHISLDEIARRIGDQHSTVKRFYRALMVLQQAENAGVFGREDRQKKHFSFSHLYTGLDYPGIAKYIGLPRDNGYKEKPVPQSRVKNLGELCVWLYGSKSRDKPPVVESQNPDLRILDDVLLSKDGVAALRSGLPLTVARDIGKGDEKLFREAFVSAKQSLQEARGKLLTGYKGEIDLLVTAQEISELAGSIYEEMSSLRGRRSRKQRT
ncbi:MAG: hypothetical protein IH856_23900 [Deltaproteobacteria bacterium]|nr:hypothetical protein [Deltaproteobacteria bacterium]